MTNENSLARWAGGVYLLVVVTGVFSMGYVPGKLAASGDPHAMLDQVVAHEALFRAGVASYLVEQLAFVLLPLLLFRLFSPAHRSAAVLMTALALASVPIALVAVGHRMDALWLLTDAHDMPAETARALARLSMKAYGHDEFLASVFWGAWLLPFGYLVIRSGMLPRVLGVLLILGGCGYLVDIFADLLLTGYAGSAFSNYVHVPSALGEIGTCLWMLVMGVRRGSLPLQPASGGKAA